MKNLLSYLLLLSLLITNAFSQGITTIDFVKILDGKKTEAHYFYTNNWATFRTQALVSEWIADYQLLEVDHKNWDLILITSFSDFNQFKEIEARFANWQEQNPMNLLNALTPDNFRKNVETITTSAKTTALPNSWKASDHCTSEVQRAFDFWIGTWVVTTPNGAVDGRNTILPIQGGCALQEVWISPDGVYKGTSYSFYNTSTRRWNQSWIDNRGIVLQLSGGIEEGKMVMSTLPFTNTNDELEMHRIIWIPNNGGTVEQIWEKSVDNGLSWELVFHGVYTKENNN